MNSDFKLLKVFASLFRIAAWVLLLVIGGVGSVAVFMGTGVGQPVPKWYCVQNLLVGAFWFLIFYTISEVIKILLAIEARSRKTQS